MFQQVKFIRIFFRYQTLVAQCKDSISKWETFCEEHNVYLNTVKDINSSLDVLENKFVALQNETSVDVTDKFKKLQMLVAEKDKNSDKITDFVSCGESLFPDTATSGREIIRKELKEARERFVK